MRVPDREDVGVSVPVTVPEIDDVSEPVRVLDGVAVRVVVDDLVLVPDVEGVLEGVEPREPVGVGVCEFEGSIELVDVTVFVGVDDCAAVGDDV